jgi:hypothetical protein
MVSSRKTPLWLRALKDPTAAKFLKKHADEFPDKSFLPDPIEFGSHRKHANEQIATLIAAHMPFKNKKHQRLAELFLTMPPREIAEKLGWDRNTTYLRIRALKRFVLDKNRREKAALVNGRGKDAKLDSEPRFCAVRNLKFTLHEQEKFAYLIQRDEQTFWVDENGVKFPQTVQDVLNELDEHAAGFEVLDVE